MQSELTFPLLREITSPGQIVLRHLADNLGLNGEQADHLPQAKRAARDVFITINSLLDSYHEPSAY